MCQGYVTTSYKTNAQQHKAKIDINTGSGKQKSIAEI